MSDMSFPLARFKRAANSYTWAAKPSAATGNGEIIFVSDVGVGGSFWFSDGSNWRPIGGRVTLHNLAASAGSNSTSEAVRSQVLFPANLLKTGDVIRITLGTAKSGTADTMTFRLRFGTAGTTADTQLAASASPATTNQTLGAVLEFSKASATAVSRRGNGSTVNAWIGVTTSARAADVTVTDMDANAMYLSLTSSMGSGAETGTVYDFTVELIAGA